MNSFLLNIFPVSFGVYLFMVLIQGLKWDGFFYKHLNVAPEHIGFLTLVFCTYSLFRYLKNSELGIVNRWLLNIVLSLSPFLITTLLVIYLIAMFQVESFVLTTFKFHYHRLVEAITTIYAFLGGYIMVFVVLINKDQILASKLNKLKMMIKNLIFKFNFIVKAKLEFSILIIAILGLEYSLSQQVPFSYPLFILSMLFGLILVTVYLSL
jgi:hypothetical protein